MHTNRDLIATILLEREREENDRHMKFSPSLSVYLLLHDNDDDDFLPCHVVFLALPCYYHLHSFHITSCSSSFVIARAIIDINNSTSTLIFQFPPNIRYFFFLFFFSRCVILLLSLLRANSRRTRRKIQQIG